MLRAGSKKQSLKGLCVKIRKQTNEGHLVGRVYYKLPDQREQVGENFLLQL